MSESSAQTGERLLWRTSRDALLQRAADEPDLAWRVLATLNAFRIVIAVTLLALLLAGPGYQAGLLELRPAFSVLRVAAGGAVLALVVGLAAALMNWRRGTQGMLAVGIVAALVGLALTLNNVGWYRKARSVPLIHDITTDLDNPPVFVDVLPLRADAFAFSGRKQKKRLFRRLWITRLTAAVKPHGLRYSQFICGIQKAGIKLNRKELSEMAIHDPATFGAICGQAKSALS